MDGDRVGPARGGAAARLVAGGDIVKSAVVYNSTAAELTKP